jgi:hypothetical protein
MDRFLKRSNTSSNFDCAWRRCPPILIFVPIGQLKGEQETYYVIFMGTYIFYVHTAAGSKI